MKRLANIDIAQTSNDALVKQDCFQIGPLACASLRKLIRPEGVSQRFGAQIPERRMLVELQSSRQVHKSEATRIIVDNPDPV